MIDIEKERAAFSEWAKSENFNTNWHSVAKFFTSTDTQVRWEVWQAARATPPAPTCPHRVADARNQYVESGYLCMDCGAVFAAADHAPPAPTPAAAEGRAERGWPTNEELIDLWNERHYGHAADFAADVLERWGGCPAGLLGHGGALERNVAPLPRQAAVQGDSEMLDWLESMGNQPEGLLLHDGGDFTGRCGLGLRRIGRTLREACKQAMGVPAAPTVKASQSNTHSATARNEEGRQ